LIPLVAIFHPSGEKMTTMYEEEKYRSTAGWSAACVSRSDCSHEYTPGKKSVRTTPASVL
jgi:hypothetical protein